MSGDGNRSYNSIDGCGDSCSRYTGSYTLNIGLALQPGDVLLYQGTSWISDVIIGAESTELGTSARYSHAAIYLGNNQVAEMLALGFRVRSLTTSMQGASLVDVYRHVDIGNRGPDVASAARRLGNAAWWPAPYAYSQIEVLAAAALTPGEVNPALLFAYGAYVGSGDYGSGHMICSELVARAFNQVDPSLQPSVQMWPTMGRIGNLSSEFRMDFTTPNMLALSSSLSDLHHVW